MTALSRTWRAAALAGLALSLAPAEALAHEGQLVRVVQASARRAENDTILLDVLSTLSLPRTASMLAIAQLDFNHDGRFDALEKGLAEAVLGPRADLGLSVTPGDTPGPPESRQVAVQIDVEGKHVSVAVLSTYRAPTAGPSVSGAFLVRFAGPGESLDFTVAAPPGLTLEGPTQARLIAGDAGVRLVIRAAPR